MHRHHMRLNSLLTALTHKASSSTVPSEATTLHLQGKPQKPAVSSFCLAQNSAVAYENET
eukprot:COSAG06_NODE_5934_length_3200_cov_29.593035_2_plen_60_part_00